MANVRGDNLQSALSAMLRRRQDEFSVQYSIESDPRFWVRVALPLTRPLVVTDFLFGTFDEPMAAAALQAVLQDLRLEDVGSIEFTRLGPAGTEEAAENVTRIGQVVEAYVLRSQRFVRLRSVTVYRGESNLRILFWDTVEPNGAAKN